MHLSASRISSISMQLTVRVFAFILSVPSRSTIRTYMFGDIRCHAAGSARLSRETVWSTLTQGAFRSTMCECFIVANDILRWDVPYDSY